MAGCAGLRSDVVVQLATVVLALLGGVGVPGVVVEAVNGVTEEVGWDEAAMACRNRHN